MTPAHFAAWCDHMRTQWGWSDRECARRLGCGHNQVGIWRAKGAPRYIALACANLAQAIGPWTPKPPADTHKQDRPSPPA